MNRRFVIKYAFVYIHCAICFLMVCSSFLTVFGVAYSNHNAGFIYDAFFNIDFLDGGAGFGRRHFWNVLSAVPLIIYVSFCRVIPFRLSIACAFFFLIISFVPPVFYMLLESGNVLAYLLGYHWTNYLPTILTALSYLYITIDLSVYKLIDMRDAHNNRGEKNDH